LVAHRDLSAEEQRAYDRLSSLYTKGIGSRPPWPPSRTSSTRRRGAGPSGRTPTSFYFNEVDKGGHVAAWEQPELFSSELRAAFTSLR